MQGKGFIVGRRTLDRWGRARVAAVVGAFIALVLVLFGWTLPATAAVEAQDQAAAESDGTAQAIAVGSLAFMLMIVAAGAVLWFTMQARDSEPR